jgi:hypothetical protein
MAFAQIAVPVEAEDGIRLEAFGRRFGEPFASMEEAQGFLAHMTEQWIQTDLIDEESLKIHRGIYRRIMGRRTRQ